jgi:hypothetical protein
MRNLAHHEKPQDLLHITHNSARQGEYWNCCGIDPLIVMDRISPMHPPLSPNGKPMAADNIHELRERIAEFDEIK